MSLYKVMSDDETSVVLMLTSGGHWKTCATFESDEAANVYIAHEDRRDVAKELSALLTRMGNGQNVDRTRMRLLCKDLISALDCEDAAFALLQGEREEDAA